MENRTDRTFFQEGDQVRIKRTGEQGRINAADGGVVYVLMTSTNEAKIFSAAIDEDAYIELVLPEAHTQQKADGMPPETQKRTPSKNDRR